MSTGQPHGSWFGRLLAHLPSYLASDDKEERGEFIADISRRLGQAPNTTWRQLVALQYLASHGIDLHDLSDRRPPALLAIESVARVGKINRALEAELLKNLVSARKTVQYFVQAAKEAKQNKQPVALESLPSMTLSSLLEAQLFPQGLYKDAFRAGQARVGLGFHIQFPGRGGRKILDRSPLLPLVVVDQGNTGKSLRTAVLVADHAIAIAQDPNFQALFEGSVLRSLVTCDKVVVCANIALSELDNTMRLMREEHLARLQLIHCHLDVDIAPPRDGERFQTAGEYLDGQRQAHRESSAEKK